MNRILIPIVVLLIFCGCSEGSNNNVRKLSHEEKSITGLNQSTVKDSVSFEGVQVGGYSRSKIIRLVEDYSLKSSVKPLDAKINAKTWEIQPEKPGKTVDVNNTVEALLNAASGENIKAALIYDSPKVKKADLEKYLKEIGYSATPILDDQASRVNNIEIAAGDIDNYILKPGEEFSFNDALGKRTASKGYKKAPIIVRTESGSRKGKGIGGGICQLSTTVYNAAEKAGLNIVERHTHSKKVNYVEKGKDATVAYGAADLKFVNSRKFPVMLKVNFYDGNVIARIIENSMPA